MRFHKYEALGNDYLIVDRAAARQLAPALVGRICDRHRGVGADGILVDDSDLGAGSYRMRVLNPDGSEAEKSGNGLRIFARYLWDRGLVPDQTFPVETRGGTVLCEVREGGRMVFVEMGRASFDSDAIPVRGPRREVVGEVLPVDGNGLKITAVTVGNPHCVLHVDDPTPELARRLGPRIENHEAFPNRTNVQFCKVLDPHRIRIEIWERGAGHTLASGSSACAAAAASVRRGFCNGDVTVVMPGGDLQIGVRHDFSLTMLGPASKVAEGQLADELLEAAGGRP
jgi:diaminopimelate epimerase